LKSPALVPGFLLDARRLYSWTAEPNENLCAPRHTRQSKLVSRQNSFDRRMPQQPEVMHQ
jgi:hypothetical protein